MFELTFDAAITAKLFNLVLISEAQVEPKFQNSERDFTIVWFTTALKFCSKEDKIFNDVI